ncbi:rhodanese-related sulfurtransferase [Rubricella aquisinus]|uniref:Rhodanese-related sulfurtransferase n=1 Tax=Rubricella aquisinus TaxID=2028108 RepID=A0A840WWU3_9RHOB|nr:rhodanese-like domain-containing protein [Rubricella aquisinus]MBB5515650.1 rhodanese-related sulfurtransferase [Rubricella aquisinus]
MKSVKEMVDEANAIVDHLPGAEALALHGREDVTFVDLRDIRELKREGRVPGAFHCPRGMLEFWLDPASPYANDVFQKGGTYVFFCAAGWRSALAARTAQEMGLEGVTHIEDGFAGWRDAGGAVETD